MQDDSITFVAPNVLPPGCFSGRRVALGALSEADHGSLTDCASVDSHPKSCRQDAFRGDEWRCLR